MTIETLIAEIEAHQTAAPLIAMSMVPDAVMAQQSGAGNLRRDFKGPLRVFILAGQSNMEG